MPHRAWVPLLAVASLVAFAATGLAGDGEADVHPLTSAGDELVPAEVPVTVGWVLTDDEGQPAFHQDARVHVTHEGDTLLETVPSSGHDYDGVDPYRVSFPEPGNFTVEAEIVDDGEVRRLAYEGTVGPAPSEELDLAIEAPGEVAPGERVTLGAEVTDEEGRPVEDVETTLRLQRTADRFEVLKTQLAGAEPTMGYSFARTGTFQLVAVAQPVPGGQATGFAPVSERVAITVEGPPSPPSVGAPVEQPLRNDRDTAEQDADGADLFVTYDPYTSIGPHGRLRLGMLTLDETTHAPVEDVGYRISILDPDREQILQTSAIEAPEGFETVTLNRPHEGTYTVHVTAERGDWTESATGEFTVLPPTVATNAGPLFATPNASTSLDAGDAQRFPIAVEDGAGVPLTHGEVDVRWLDEDGIPQVTGKLHVHENGTFPITLSADEPGEHRLELYPQSLQPTPTPYTYGEAPGQPPVFDVDVAAVDDEPMDVVLEASEDASDEVPAAGLVGVVVGLAGAVGLMRRS